MTGLRSILASTYTVSTLIFVLATANWALHPEHGLKWAVAMLCLPAGRGAVALIRVRSGRGAPSEDERRYLHFSLNGAGWIVAASLAVGLDRELGFADGPMLKRMVGILTGAFFIAMGDAMPKVVVPLSRLRCNPTMVRSFHRYAGWVFVLTGFATAMVWTVLTVDRASEAAIAVCLTGVTLVASRLSWMAVTGKFRKSASGTSGCNTA